MNHPCPFTIVKSPLQEPAGCWQQIRSGQDSPHVPDQNHLPDLVWNQSLPGSPVEFYSCSSAWTSPKCLSNSPPSIPLACGRGNCPRPPPRSRGLRPRHSLGNGCQGSSGASPPAAGAPWSPPGHKCWLTTTWERGTRPSHRCLCPPPPCWSSPCWSSAGHGGHSPHLEKASLSLSDFFLSKEEERDKCWEQRLKPQLLLLHMYE